LSAMPDHLFLYFFSSFSRQPSVLHSFPTRALPISARSLQTHFGRLDVPWQDVLRLRRGTVDLGLFGGPDLLHAVYGRPGGDGRKIARAHSELQSLRHLVCRLLLDKQKYIVNNLEWK